MGSGEQELPEAEIAQGGDGSAADDGKPPLEPIAQAAEQSEQVVIDLHAVGRVGYGGQRSVEIEEQRGPGQQPGRRRGEMGNRGKTGIGQARKLARGADCASSSEERRVGKEWVGTCKCRVTTEH